MASYSKEKLSGSTNGKQIKITATAAGSAVTIHTAQSGTDYFDEIWIYATNNDSSPVTLTLLYGGTTDPDDYISITIPAESGLTLVVGGLILQNSLVVKGFADVANKISVSGFVNRVSA